MSCSASRDWAPLLAVVSGVAAHAMPLVAPLGILITAMAAIAVLSVSNSPLRPLRIALGIFILGSALAGYLDSCLATALLSALVLLCRQDTAAVAIAVLLAQTSVASSLTALASQVLPLGLEAAAPALIVTACLWLSRPIAAALAITAIASSLILAEMATLAGAMPPLPMLAAAISPIAFGCALVVRRRRQHNFAAYVALLGVIGAVSTWAWTLPRTAERLVVLLPSQPTAYTAQFFKHYMEALSFAGVNANLANRPEDIPSNSIVLLPWLTDPLPSGDAADKDLGTLARDRSWTVLLIGEHTNLGEVAARVERITGRRLLRQDLTVPPRNRDESGPLHVSGLRAWPGDAILNRGASVAISSISDRILLAGDGWWSEKDTGEWLWVGDYLWRPGDTAGRVTLAAAFDDGSSRWIVVGDNSPFINRQLVADPRPVLRLLDASSLWPAFTRDAVILTMVVSWLVSGIGPVLVLTGGAALVTFAFWMNSAPGDRWKGLFRGESGFDAPEFQRDALASSSGCSIQNDGHSREARGHPLVTSLCRRQQGFVCAGCGNLAYRRDTNFRFSMPGLAASKLTRDLYFSMRKHASSNCGSCG